MFLSLILALPLLAQQNMRIEGMTHFEGFGMAIAGLNDVDGDGMNDFVVGAFCSDLGYFNAGSTSVRSSSDGHSISMPRGTYTDERLGHSVAACGDYNGDGIYDHVAGAYRHRGNGFRAGAIMVFDSLNGQTLLEVYGEAESEFGWDVDSLGDVNGDGFPDFVVGAWLEKIQGQVCGAGYVISGIDGSTLYRKPGQPNWLTGSNVANVGDLDQDGIHDFAIASPLADSGGHKSGQVDIYSGSTGLLIQSHIGPPSWEFGSSMSPAGDINGDGIPEYLIGSTKADASRVNVGAYSLYDGETHEALWQVFGSYKGEKAGYAMAPIGDMNEDGVLDFLVSHPWSNMNGNAAGIARIHSGLDGSSLQSYFGTSNADLFGGALAALGDINGDGKPELLIGSPNFGLDSTYAPGCVDLILSEPWLTLEIPNPIAGGRTDCHVTQIQPGDVIHLFTSEAGIGSDRLLPAPGIFLDLAPDTMWLCATNKTQSGSYTFSIPVPSKFQGRTMTFQILEGRRNFPDPRRSNTVQVTF